MDSELKKKLRTLSLALRHTLERDGDRPGDLQLRLNEIGVWPDRPPIPVREMVLSDVDRAARATVDAFFTYREGAGVPRDAAFQEFVRESAYSWANRLFTLRCLEARGLIDPAVILQQKVYGGRSLAHHRFVRENPVACTGEDGGLFAVLSLAFGRHARELPAVFDPEAPGIALRPSVPALKRCIGLLSGADEDDTLFQAGDALGWAYQFWNAEEKDRVFERVRTEKSTKIEGSDVIPATQLYTEPYMVKFLVQNSLGALWAGMNPDSSLPAHCEYYVEDADRTPPAHPDPPPFDPRHLPRPGADPWVRPNPNLHLDEVIAYARTLAPKVLDAEKGTFADLRNELLDAAAERSPEKLLDLNRRACEAWDAEWPTHRPKLYKRVAEISFLDPACGSGHFLLEAFDLLYQMYCEENPVRTPEEIAAAILNQNLYGIDIDERAIQIAYAALWMHARERAPELRPESVTAFTDHLVAANLALPKGGSHLEKFLANHPDDAPLAPALQAVFEGLANADQLGSLLRIEEPVELELQRRKMEEDLREAQVLRQAQGKLEFAPEQFVLEETTPKRDYEAWKRELLERLKSHFRNEAELSDPVQSFFGRNAQRGLALFDLLARRYDVVAANPPYMGSRNMGQLLKKFCLTQYSPGKRDLYAAFMLRSAELTRHDGYAALVTQQSWMFLKSFAELRAAVEKKRSGVHGVGDLLRTVTFETLAHLGANAFPEISGEVVNTVLFCLRRTPPIKSQICTTVRAVNAPAAVDKERLLKSPSTRKQFLFFRRQNDFLSIQYSPILYWIPDALLSLVCTSRILRDLSYVRQGICTTNNPRFTRYFWEVSPAQRDPRWFPFEKGGGSLRWAGFHQSTVDWEANGARIKAYQDDTPGAIHWSGRMPDEKFLFKTGWTFSRISGGTLAARLMPKASLFCNTSPAAIPYEESDLALVGFWMNTRLLTFLLRALTQRLDCQEGYIQRLPLPLGISSEMASNMNSPSLRFSQKLIQLIPTEAHFTVLQMPYSEVTALQSLYLLNEAAREFTALNFASLSSTDVETILAEVGKPVGSSPLISGYDRLPTESSEPAQLPQPTVDFFAALPRLTLSEPEMDIVRKRLRIAYETSLAAGTEYQPNDAGEDNTEYQESDEDDEAEILDSKTIPPENRLEALSADLNINPISIHWLICEGFSRQGWRRPEESTDTILDRVSIHVLRLLGYRWPTEEGDPSPVANGHGIVPITDGFDTRGLARRINQPLTGDGDLTPSIFEDVIGMPLPKWLEREFQARHIRQFRSRPIAWQVQTRPAGRGASPVLSCLLYFHRIAGALPDLRKVYAGSLRVNFETERRSLDLLPSLTIDQKDRKEKLDVLIEELREFEEGLERIEALGFATEKLRRYAIDDTVLSMARRWLARLRDAIREGPLAAWRELAMSADYPPQLPSWISAAVDQVDRQCVAIAPASPPPETPDDELTPSAIAELFRGGEEAMVRRGLEAICRDWQAEYHKAVVQPLKDDIKATNDVLETLPETIENKLRRKELKLRIRQLRQEIAEKTAKSGVLAERIEEWRCSEAKTWVEWLSTQQLYDEISSLDGKRQPPQSVTEFVAQESQYQPDINDGVRVNIAPLQKAGLLARDVLTPKDVDKAIADRAAWRADERRWVRQGILPRPGWWLAEQARACEAEGGQ